MAEGVTAGEVAHRLKVSARTINNHQENIYRNVAYRTDSVRYCARNTPSASQGASSGPANLTRTRTGRDIPRAGGYGEGRLSSVGAARAHDGGRVSPPAVARVTPCQLGSTLTHCTGLVRLAV